jgi:hypothetical protein
VVCVTGFDSFTDSLYYIGPTNKDGAGIKNAWKQGVRIYRGDHGERVLERLRGAPRLLDCLRYRVVATDGPEFGTLLLHNCTSI